MSPKRAGVVLALAVGIVATPRWGSALGLAVLAIAYLGVEALEVWLGTGDAAGREPDATGELVYGDEFDSDDAEDRGVAIGFRPPPDVAPDYGWIEEARADDLRT